jgi:nitrogen fixation/metabolism regulation signal transduction histidine kinase
VAAALAGVLFCLLAAAVVITHRIAGPAFAIARTCRQVGEGKLTRPRPLRVGDLLVELSGDVATMVDALRDREAQEQAALLEAARVLGDTSAGSAAREQAAAAMTMLAEEKGKRLQG